MFASPCHEIAAKIPSTVQQDSFLGLPFEPSTRTQDPIVTGAGIVACKFDNGILHFSSSC
jgi:hypothetical protein